MVVKVKYLVVGQRHRAYIILGKAKFPRSNMLSNELNEEYLTNYSWLQVHKHSPWYVFAGTGLTEEGIEGVVTAADGFVTWHLTIRLDAMLQTVQLPAGVTNLDTGLADVDTDTFTLKKRRKQFN